LCLLCVGDLKVNVSSGRMSLRIAARNKRKFQSNIVCLCGLQWLGFSSIKHVSVNVSSGRKSLRIAATKTKRKSKSNIVCLCGLQGLCLLSVGDLKVNVSSGRMSSRIAAMNTRENVFVKYRRSESKCFFRSYVFADCGHEHKRKSQSNIVCLCGLQWLGFSSIKHV